MTADRVHSQDTVRRLIIAALRDPAGVPSLPPRELDLTLRVMRRARLLGRLAADLEVLDRLADLSPVIADQLYSALRVAEARARVGRWELDRIAWALRDLPEVPIVALKGCAYLLAGTPNARGRTFADVDLLVPESHLSDVEAKLRQHGWGTADLTPYDDRYYRVWAHELPPLRHEEREVEVDVHHNILMRTARLKPSSALLFESARDVPGSRFKALAPVDMVLHAIAHLFYGGEMDDALRELVDIDDLLRHFAASEPGFWEQFWPRVEALDLARPAFYGLRYVGLWLGTTVPGGVLEASRAGAPSAALLRLMDWLVPLGLFPRPLEGPCRRVGLARWMLYVRSHWVKMPPPALAAHLARKASSRVSRGGQATARPDDHSASRGKQSG